MNVTNKTPTAVVIAIQDHQLAAVIIFLIASLGTVCNALVAIFTRRLATLNNPFGRLTASQSTGELILCSIFVSYYTPMVFFDIALMKEYAKHAGLILLMCYNICIISHLIIALNRMCAICTPVKYDIYFSYRNTSILIAFIWIVSIAAPFYLHGMEDCSIVYSDIAWVFIFKDNRTCGFISWYIDFGLDFSIVVIISVVDAITIIKVRLTSKQFARTGCRVTNSRRSRDIKFLKQAVAQGIIFAAELSLYFFLGWTFKNKWAIFACTTVAWNLVHSCDPIIIIAFNKEFRRLVCSPMRAKLRKSTSIHPHASSTQDVPYTPQTIYSNQLIAANENETVYTGNPLNSMNNHSRLPYSLGSGNNNSKLP